MELQVDYDHEALRQACERRGVKLLQVFGSAVTEDFDPERSDVDFFVEFRGDVPNLLRAYIGLEDDLREIFGRDVDVVFKEGVKNPFFEKMAFPQARDLYAA